MVRKWGIPVAELKVEEVALAKRKAVEELRNAIARDGMDPNEFVYRELLPKDDFNFTNQEWKESYTATFTDTDLVNITLPDRKYIALYGVGNLNPDPLTVYIAIEDASGKRFVMQLEPLYANERPEAIFTDPIVFRQNDKLVIKGQAKATGDDKVYFKGIVAEHKGVSIIKV